MFFKNKFYFVRIEPQSIDVVSDLMKELMSDPKLRKIANEVAKFTNAIASEINEMSEDRKQRQLKAKVVDEYQALKEAEDFLNADRNLEHGHSQNA